MDLKLNDRVAVVTGGASGIGAAVVRTLREEGARVSVWDLNPDPADPDALTVDVTAFDQVTTACSRTQERLGPIDILVHAAAVGSGHFGFPFTNVPITAWERVLNVNIMGMTNVAYAAAPGMQQRRQGVMLFVSSVAGQIGSQTDPPYSAAKAANINFAQCLARDLAPAGVRVNTICPGMVKTPLNRSVWQAWHDQQPAANRISYEDWAEQKIRRVVPLGRWQTVDDIAAMIVFLCSDRACEVTGQTINVDGGLVMNW